MLLISNKKLKNQSAVVMLLGQISSIFKTTAIAVSATSGAA